MMKVQTPSGASIQVQDPVAPTPGGVITVKDPDTGEHFQVQNPLGADTVVLAEDTYLVPVYEQQAGALNRGSEGRAIRHVLVGYETTDADDPRGSLHPAGEVVRVDLLPIGVPVEGGEDE